MFSLLSQTTTVGFPLYSSSCHHLLLHAWFFSLTNSYNLLFWGGFCLYFFSLQIASWFIILLTPSSQPCKCRSHCTFEGNEALRNFKCVAPSHRMRIGNPSLLSLFSTLVTELQKALLGDRVQFPSSLWIQQNLCLVCRESVRLWATLTVILNETGKAANSPEAVGFLETRNLFDERRNDKRQG